MVSFLDPQNRKNCQAFPAMRMCKNSWVSSHFIPVETNNKISLSYTEQGGFKGSISLQGHYEISLYLCSALPHN